MKALILVAAVAVAGPAPADVVVVRDAVSVANCRALGEVRSSSSWGGVFANATYNRVLNQMKQRAASLGGTHVQIVDSSSGYTGARMIGTAFHCGANLPGGHTEAPQPN